MKGLGIVLIVLGILGFVFGGIAFTRKETVADIGPIEIQATEKERIPIAPIASGAAVVAGLVLVLAGARKRA
jgi:Na+-transporting methylmalonyl-CoA/oxaloacetate decarboxylase gamma subunit